MSPTQRLADFQNSPWGVLLTTTVQVGVIVGLAVGTFFAGRVMEHETRLAIVEQQFRGELEQKLTNIHVQLEHVHEDVSEIKAWIKEDR